MKSAFFTRAKANEGIKLELTYPDGTPTEFWMRIRGVDSDSYKESVSAMRAKIFALSGADSKEDKAALLDMTKNEALNMLVSLVAAWNIEDDDGNKIAFTEANVREFLREAPQIGEQIDRLSTRRTLFFGKSLKPSTPSQSATSSSPSPSTVASPASL